MLYNTISNRYEQVGGQILCYSSPVCELGPLVLIINTLIFTCLLACAITMYGKIHRYLAIFFLNRHLKKKKAKEEKNCGQKQTGLVMIHCKVLLSR